jgi:anti-sigma-K factor RskA
MIFRDADDMAGVAGEYVLGVLPQNEMDDVEREMSRNHDLAVAVGFWRDKLLDVAPPTTAIEPASDTWERINRQISGASRGEVKGRWWDNLFFWRVSGIAGALATILLSLYLVFTVQRQEEEKYIAVLQPPGAGAAWLVEVDAKVVRLRPLSPVSVPSGKSVQFWTKPAGAAGPTSLGLVAADRPTTVTTDKLPGMAVDQLFEVTLEPERGSPVDRPTGPILAVGKAVPL